ncbi:myosin PfM-C, putative [Plasmodium vivax]|uniref:Myosin PfM-C, putative n=1 Tax=Plasmodium vivax (strain Salvador I) TaxID=126793 RepID=A5K7U0_PLAVS|nr:myosin PfM-C, putative [Plasmodium vivax]EDL44354.1 myosin PfM-C, putative [Plasmodium vivax]|eukprot:XP_001614081.1 myosin PfM-C [Plasmodium vivax Sal-1]
MDSVNKCVVGTKVFVRDKQKVWVCAEVVKEETELVVKTEDDEIVVLKEKDEFHLKNLDVFDSNGLSAPADLTKLTHLHEASILHSLNVRFDIDEIYTFTGPILIAVNPFKMIPDLYSDSMLAKHVQPIQSKSPHIFSTANSAYLGMCQHNKSQTILISGESGAGKTESTKYVMKFLACAGSDIKRRSLIECQILESNPLLEAFGNARTLRNDNSSRFGKYIELQFSLDRKGGGQYYTRGKLCGAKIRTYLLEKVRVCYQQEGERNYHIFYQLCRAAREAARGAANEAVSGEASEVVDEVVSESPSNATNPSNAANCANSGNAAKIFGPPREYRFPATEKYRDPELGAKAVRINMSGFQSHEHFRYLTKSSVHELSDVNELEQFETTVYAMQTIGISEEEQHQIFRVLEGILYMGNVLFVNDESREECRILDDSLSDLKMAASFLDVDAEELRDALCYRTIVANNECYKKPVNAVVANDVRDALARAIYGCLFLKVVERTNESVGFLEDATLLFCGVLDIFGFESFAVNSFEQLCINYTNECLQQFFNNFIFKCEEKLYVDEGIEWDPLDFPDNVDSVNLLESKPYGVFCMLDEECYVPSGKDRTFCSKIISKHCSPGGSGTSRFMAVKTDPSSFVIIHFAGKVTYNSSGFLEKNKDQLSADVQKVLLHSESEYTSSLFQKHLRRNVEKKRIQTVSSEFKEQLHQLMRRIKETEPHFIRCIKPNSQNVPDLFDRISVNEQLKYGGVLQAIKVSRSGYPVRLTHTDCVRDYSVLLPKEGRELFRGYAAKSWAQRATFVLSQLHRCDAIQDLLRSLGARRRAEEAAANTASEANTADTANEGNLANAADLATPESALLWAVGKSLCFFKSDAYSVLSALRSDLRAAQAVVIQKNYKAYRQRRLFLTMKRKVVLLQRWARHILVVLQNERTKVQRATQLICLHIYGYTVRRSFLRQKKCATIIQAHVRGYLARRHFQHYRVNHYASLIKATWKMHKQRRHMANMKRAAEIIQLKWKGILARRQLRRLKEEAKEVGALIKKNQCLVKQINQERKKKMEAEHKLLQAFASVEKLAKRVDLLERNNRENENVIKGLMERLAQANAPPSSETPISEIPSERTRIRAAPPPRRDDPAVEASTAATVATAATAATATSATTSAAAASPERGTPAQGEQMESLLSKIKQLELENKEHLKKNNALNERYQRLLGLLSHFRRKDVCLEGGEAARELLSGHAAKVLQRGSLSEWRPVEKRANRSGDDGDDGDHHDHYDHRDEHTAPPNARRTVHRPNGRDVDILMCGPKGVGKTSLLEDLFVRIGDEINLNLLRKNKKKNANESNSFVYDTYVVAHKSSSVKICDYMYSGSPSAEEGLFNLVKSSASIVVVFDSSNGDSIHPALHLLQEAALTNVKRRTKLYLLENIFNEKINMKKNACDVSYSLRVAKACNAHYVKALDMYEIVNNYVCGARSYLGSFPGQTYPMQRGGDLSPWRHCERYHHVARQIGEGPSPGDYISAYAHAYEYADVDAHSHARALKMGDPGKSAGETPAHVNHLNLPPEGECPPNHFSPKHFPPKRDQQTAHPNQQNSVSSMVSSFKSICGVTHKKNPHAQLLKESLPHNSYIYGSKKYNVEMGKGLQPIFEVTLKGSVPITYLLIGQDSINKMHTLLAVGCKDGVIYIYKCSRTPLESAHGISGVTAVSSVSSVDGAGGEEGAPAKLVTKLSGHKKAITCLVFSFTEEKIISSSIDRTIKIWEVATGFLLKVFSDSSATLSVLLLPTNLDLFLCSNCTSLLRIVNVNTGHVNQKIKFESEIRTLEIDDTGLNIFAGSKNGTLYILEIVLNERVEIRFKLLFSLSPITCIRFVPKQPLLASPLIVVNSCDNHMGIIECVYGSKGAVLTSLSVKHRIRINHALLPIRSSFSRFGGGWVVSGSEDGNIYVCSLLPHSNYRLVFLKHHKAPVMAVVVNDIDTLMVSGDSKGNVVFWRRAFV